MRYGTVCHTTYLILGSKVEQDLTSKLLNNYDKKIRPSTDPKEPVNVGVGIALNKLTNIVINFRNFDPSMFSLKYFFEE